MLWNHFQTHQALITKKFAGVCIRGKIFGSSKSWVEKFGKGSKFVYKEVLNPNLLYG